MEPTEDRIVIGSFVTKFKSLATGRFKDEMNYRETVRI